MSSKSGLLKTASFGTFSNWDVKQFFLIKVSSAYSVEKLGNHIIHQTEKVQLSDFPGTLFGILGVSNKIGMFDADTALGKSINQKYHIVKDNWLAYNPYRINVGSIGLKTSAQKGEYISPAYVVFSCKETLIPEYIWLLMKSSMFNSLIRGSTTGTVRQTLGYDNLAEILAPIPPIVEQQKLLDEYHRLLNQSIMLNNKADKENASQLTNIQKNVSAYTKNAPTQEDSESLLNIIRFTSTDRWEVGYIYKEGVIDSVVESFKYPALPIGKLQKESLFGLSVKASLEQKGGMIPVLRMSNVQKGEIDYGELKYLPYECAVTDKEPDKWLLRKGDFLITRTNGSKDLVGKAAVFESDDTYTYASYLIRYRFDTDIVLPDYVNIIFMTPLVREQIAVMRRQGGGQYNLNSDEINSIQIPVPDIPAQRKVIQLYQDSLIESKRLRKQANNSVNTADEYLETSLYK